MEIALALIAGVVVGFIIGCVCIASGYSNHARLSSKRIAELEAETSAAKDDLALAKAKLRISEEENEALRQQKRRNWGIPDKI